MPSKYVIISGIYPPEIGGPASFAKSFSQWLSKDGNVSILAYGERNLPVTALEDGVEVFRISRKMPIWKRYVHFIYRIFRLRRGVASFLVIGGFVETVLASLVFRFSYVAKVPGDIVWERARNKGYSNETLRSFQVKSLDLKYSFFRKVYSKSLTRAKFVIVPSKELLELCLLWGVKEERLSMIHNSVARDEFFPKVNSEYTYDVITVCRLTPWKGVSELISTCADLNLSLLIVGDGPEREVLEVLSEKEGCAASFVGNVSTSEMAKYYQSARVFVLNSEYEGLPHALLEARSSGCICVARAGTGSQEVIKTGVNGFLIKNSKDLHAVLARVFHGTEDFGAIIDSGISDNKNRFDQERNFQKIKHLITQ